MTSSRVRWLWAPLLLGCGPGLPGGIEGFSDGFADEVGDGDGDTGTGDGDGDGDGDTSTGDGDGDLCPQVELPSDESFVFDDLLSADDLSTFLPLCVPVDTADRTLLWTAPSSGLYEVALISEVDASVGVLDGACGGAALGCAPGFGEPIQFDVIGGQDVTFVIESEQTGAFELIVQRLETPQSCPVGELDGTSDLVGGSTLGADLQFGSDCGGSESGDQGWLFVPPVGGTYRFDTAGSNFDTILYVLDDVCGGPVLACIDDNPLNTQAVLDVDLLAGHAYTIVVDGFGGQAGDYQLSLELLDSPGGLCESAEILPSTLPVQLAWPVDVDAGNLFDGCSDASHERRFRWTAPEDALVRITQDAGGNPSGLAVFPEGCAELNFFCETITPAVNLLVSAGQELLIVSEYEPLQPGEVILGIAPMGVVPGCGTALPEGAPVMTMGTTNGSNDDHMGSCGFNPAPEREFWWTAPETATYTISTAGSNYDSLLYVRDGGCEGAELACDDDFEGSLAAQLDVDLEAGQTISIFVDGFNGAGSFNLSITEK
ncbi:hypothetical protein ACNOYE_25100 [Nannocystaceae bacterium ST9]